MPIHPRLPGRPVLVSAHRCGAGDDRSLENTRPALEAALASGVDFVEVDVRRCADGTLVCFHDERVTLQGRRVRLESLDYAAFAAAAPQHLLFEDVLRLLAGRARAHVDLKLTSPTSSYADPASTHEVAVTRLALEHLRPADVIVTTLVDKSVRAVRDWADAHGHDILVGLSLGRPVTELPWWRQVAARLSEIRPARRIRASRANLVVAQYTVARLGAASFARRHGIPLLVWTVDSERGLRRWLRPGRAWLVTSNHPDRALAVRDAHRGGRYGIGARWLHPEERVALRPHRVRRRRRTVTARGARARGLRAGRIDP
ncbi:glycerophosphodiester phosphodiesterase [Nocardioides bruguierae]|uniref:Glycerophosphodiester phosphodiesterase n=1 Tax=Nocardioides bruguierae TaxID=2945102 RepID=A0A9X2IET2_9ACTN|nr:glycerophosphodiester phosphodiesterase [Nocardioides bruguierae]MCM0618940.1 glycerophosphodiester phosphodiesterase [Nocardioides bruguierae]